MAKRLTSVFTDDMDHCIVCLSGNMVERHHIFNKWLRKKSEEDGYIIPLCRKHHTGDMGTVKEAIHHNQLMAEEWKRKAQRHFEETHTRDEFRVRYDRSYF